MADAVLSTDKISKTFGGLKAVREGADASLALPIYVRDKVAFTEAERAEVRAASRAVP